MRLFRSRTGQGRAIFASCVALLWYGFWAILALVIEGLCEDPSLRARIELHLPLGLLLLFLYWQISPIMSASFGAGLDLRRLLVYPVPRGRLFAVEVLLRVTVAIEVLLVLSGAFVGLVRNPVLGGRAAAVRMLPPLLL